MFNKDLLLWSSQKGTNYTIKVGTFWFDFSVIRKYQAYGYTTTTTSSGISNGTIGSLTPTIFEDFTITDFFIYGENTRIRFSNPLPNGLKVYIANKSDGKKAEISWGTKNFYDISGKLFNPVSNGTFNIWVGLELPSWWNTIT